MLEDSPAGVASGTTAGCAVLAVSSVTGILPAERRLVVASLGQVDVDALIGLVQREAA